LFRKPQYPPVLLLEDEPTELSFGEIYLGWDEIRLGFRRKFSDEVRARRRDVSYTNPGPYRECESDSGTLSECSRDWLRLTDDDKRHLRHIWMVQTGMQCLSKNSARARSQFQQLTAFDTIPESVTSTTTNG
jgi:hypothetical protein